jgi:beta-1,4-mannosyltransferase
MLTLILSAILSAVILLGVAWRLQSKRPSSKPSLRSVAILVLGDIGRSPRMMYHAESFAKLHFETFLIGYEGPSISALVLSCQNWLFVAGSKPVPSLLSLPHVHFLYISQLPPSIRKLPFLIFAPVKIAQQVISILHALFWRIPHTPEFILVQVSLLATSPQGGREQWRRIHLAYLPYP